MFFVCVNRVDLGFVVYFLAGLNTIIGGIGGLNQTRFRPLLAYSSIGHIGWIIVAGRIGSGLFLWYFFLYAVLNLGIMVLLGNVNIKGVGGGLMSRNFLFYISLIVCLISLGGVPPFLGFFPKWMVLSYLNFLSVPLIIILGSLINLFYYLSICFSIYVSSKNYSLGVGRLDSLGGVVSVGLILGNLGFPLLMFL